jgi:UDP-MurNAc hydroxylase
MFKEKNLKFWGHNCFTVETQESILLIDPWFSNAGAFFGSWFQYPKNHHLKNQLLDILQAKNNSFVFISHEHQDHYDSSFLEHLPLGTNFIIPSYKDVNFKNQILTSRENLIELEDLQELRLDDQMSISLLISDIGINHDAAIFIKTKNFNFLNQNDCKVFDRLSELKDSVDYYSVQFSGATWHPSCFEFSEQRKKYISKQKANNKFNNVLNGIKQLNPKYFLPAAGPAIFPFLDPSLSFGKENIFVHQEELNNFLVNNNFSRSLFLRPGDNLSSDLTKPIPSPNQEDINDYKRNIIDAWNILPNTLDLKLLHKCIEERLQNIKCIEITNCPMLIFNFSGYFDSDDRTSKNKIFIDLNNKIILDEFDYLSDYEEIISSKKYFNLMCSEGWQNVYLSLRARVVRRPDAFNNDLNIFIFSDAGNINESFLRTRNIPQERINIRNVNDEIFEINRFCPHQGADLCNATVTAENILICPRHGWEFDLNNDGLNKSSGQTINSILKSTDHKI